MRIEVRRENENGAFGRGRDWFCGPIFHGRFRSIHSRGDQVEEDAKAPDPYDGWTFRREDTHSSGTARSAETDFGGRERQWRYDGPPSRGNHRARARERIFLMLDIVFVACTAVFFVIALAYVWACDRLN
jgi:hypothetical protein